MENIRTTEGTPACSSRSIDEECIIEMLTGGTEELDIVSIVGIGGTGKTPLARKLFTHPSILFHFDVRAWCSVSEKYNLRKMCSEILKQVLGSVDGIPNEDMPDKLRRSLIGKRYLIVLDDIWEVDAWEELRLCSSYNENGSRVMLTTRLEQVARQLKHCSDPYFLRSIDYEVIDGFEEYSERMVKKLTGRTEELDVVSVDYEVRFDEECIIEMLTGGTEELDIVSIVGTGGAGKTRLTRKVFTHPSILFHFDARAWCYISQAHNLRKVCSEILKQVLGIVDGTQNEDMPDKLRKSLFGKRYLIVLDGIWDVEAWEKLRLCFPDNENGSRVVLTTRLEQVARQLKHHSDPYFLRSIDYEVIVGFEEEAESIVQKLTGRTEELDVVSIFGMPGLGKTTLAKKVFTHPNTDKHFDVRAWCSVSKDYNLRKVCSQILKQILGSMDGIQNEDMPDKLRKSLIRKRYLIVLDDIWEIKPWEELWLCFPDNENGSRVVVTTRDEQVARQLKHQSDPYRLRFLTVDESWDLLQKKIFQGDICPPELHETGLRIAESCKGLPLAIVLIAGTIAKQKKASLWLEIAENLRSHVLEEQSMKIIESSYDYLEDHLKSCLLYMGLFPEDYKFPVSDLLNFWIAENFVHNMGLENMEEASKICLSDLVSRSLVIISGRREDNDEIEYCSVHDVVHEFCMRKLTKEEFMQYRLVKKPQFREYIHEDLVGHLLQHERLLDKFPMFAGLNEGEFVNQCNARSLEFINNPYLSPDDSIRFFCLLDKLRFIRVLHLLDVNLETSSWAMAVQVVTQLRYLAIRTQEFDFQWVSHLHDLQTLQVVGNANQLLGYFETSPSIWKMQKLRHVDIQDFSFKWKDNDRALFEESSETLLPNLKTFGKCRIYLVDKTPEFWWRFPNIEQLKLHFIEQDYEVDMPNLAELPLLSLKLCFSRAISGYKCIGRASCVVFPSNVKDLTLDRLCLTEEVVSQLAGLRNLESLKLHEVYFKSEDSICWDVSDYEFRALRYLILQNVLMTEWRSSEESFPVLERLILNNCTVQCGEIPCSFVDIATLKLIKLIRCDKSLELSAINIQKGVEEMTGCDRLQVLIL